MSDRYFYVVVYDIVDDKRRTKVARQLEALGKRVQYSVFEVYLTHDELKTLLNRLKKLIKNNQDSIRGYNLCSSCRKRVLSLGVGLITPPPDVVIV